VTQNCTARANFALSNDLTRICTGRLTSVETISYDLRVNPAAHVQFPRYARRIHEINLVDYCHARVGRHQPAGQQGVRIGPAPHEWGGHHSNGAARTICVLPGQAKKG